MLFVTTIIALLYRKRFGAPPMKYIPYYLVYISLVEIGAYIIMYSPIRYNIWWYNIMLNGEVFFYFYLYYNLIQNKTVKRVLLVLLVFYIIYYLVNYFILTNDWNINQSFPFSFGSIIIIFSIFWYLIELFQSDKVLEIHKLLIFWISIGLLFYFIVSIPSLLSSYYFGKKEYINNPTTKFFQIGQFISNIIMYSFYLYGILWISKPQKS